MKLKILFPILLWASCYGLSVCQTQPTVDNYPLYPSLINPAANGSFSEMSAVLFGRKQWYSIEGSPTFFGVQFAHPYNKMSLGGSLVQESIGVHSKQTLFFTYTYRIKISNEHHLSFGISPGMIMLHSNYGKVVTTTSNDDEFVGSKSVIAPDCNFGMYYYTKKYYAGVSIPSLVENTIISSAGELKGESKILQSYWQYNFLGGYNFALTDYTTLRCSSLIRKIKGEPVDADVNILADFDENFGAGLSYSTRKELLVSGFVNISSSIRLAYCFHSYFNVKKQMLSAHEIFISYSYIRSKQATIQSPRF
jgi:type IX secretion system PorP/SprF family membrane protein